MSPRGSARTVREAAWVDGAQPQPLGVENRHSGPLSPDRRAADLGDDLDHLLDSQRLGQHRGGLLQPRCAQRRGRQLLGQPTAHLLGLALRGDVSTGAHPLDDPAVPLDRHSAHVVVPVGAGPAANPVAAVEDLAGPDAVAPGRLDPLPVVAVDRLQPALAEIFLSGLASDPAPLRRVLGNLAVRPGHPDHLRARLHQRAVPLLAAPQRLRGQMLLRDLDGDRADAADLAVLGREPGK